MGAQTRESYAQTSVERLQSFTRITAEHLEPVIYILGLEYIMSLLAALSVRAVQISIP